jgi:hypothetical protein
MPYQRHYDDSFLDGFHNYLPEILYGRPEQFGSAAPLVTYIQTRIRTELDLFSAGQRAFTNTMANHIPIVTPQRVRVVAEPPPLPRRHVDFTGINLLNELINPGLINPGVNTTVMNTLFGLAAVPNANYMEPVVVRPTAAQIAEGTAIVTVDAEDEACAICQEAMQPGSQARELQVCDHRFHTGCIDTWLQRSVHCPTCRHDIREPAAE